MPADPSQAMLSPFSRSRESPRQNGPSNAPGGRPFDPLLFSIVTSLAQACGRPVGDLSRSNPLARTSDIEGLLVKPRKGVALSDADNRNFWQPFSKQAI